MKLYNFFYYSVGQAYLNTFRGLSKEVWWLAFITLINRAGTMVIPFLSLYLTTDLNFSLDDVAWIMTAFGFGSLVGSWIGGKLTDIIGYYKVMVISLILSGTLFIGMQYLDTFATVCIGIFILMAVADMFRPAMFVALNAYSKPENKTRSITLIRLAINLGFSAGPAVGGLIITTMNYGALFWIDGFSCMIAGLLLLKVLHPKKSKALDTEESTTPLSAYTDTSFIIFLLAMVIFGIIFLQLISTIPYFYKEGVGLTEFEIGLLMAMNGLLIFTFEMPLIKWFENKSYTKIGLMIFGLLLICLSFLILVINPWLGFVIISMILLTFGEMIVFPFSNSFALDRAKRGLKGQYMALYSIAFSISHIFAHNVGFHLIDEFGFNNTWMIMSVFGLLGLGLLLYLKKQMLATKQII
ncbi:putative MFS family arabinose efflux permease [Gelidibacter sediminis]|uniref:Putative MFS family arabinose efflux permease n=1 Tax=Gelidibacter sediminis TaxID=1608710 RepID=A0A4R7Q5G4_9FLAO|nr:MFS transporter [Gelidibacter sediminis]TDU42698.1 putative MFS family arabinose efflux permease [Gelidibacter sediminis]